MTYEEAVKKYKEIRNRAQYWRVHGSAEVYKDCLRQHGWNEACGEPPEDIRLWCHEKASNVAFDDFVRNFLACKGIANPTPEQWVKAALVAPFPCHRCAGTGKFITHIENGVPRGPGGICYRCDGKGYQTHDDAMRNYYYDMRGTKT